MIDGHNQEREKNGFEFTLGVNQFADLTWEEF